MKLLWEFRVRSDPAIWIVTFITVLGAYPRLFFAATADFPLNDGGLFLTMIRDLEEAGYAIPAYASYNAAHLPFAYPPLGFYLAALLSNAFRYPLLDILRLLPPVLSVLTIPVFYWLCRSLLKDDIKAAYSSFALAVLPTSFDWMVMGGGITRSLGFLLALLLFLCVLKFLDSRRTLLLPAVSFLVCLVILSHIGVAWFAAFSACLLVVFGAREAKTACWLALAAIGGLILSAPWWLSVAIRHGLSPFFSAGENVFLTGGTLAAAIGLMFTNEPVLDLLAVTGFFGGAICLRNRKFLLPAWLGAIIVLQGRFWQICAVVPFAMLIGIGVDSLLRMLDNRTGKSPDDLEIPSKEKEWRGFPGHPIPRTVLVYIIAICFLSAILSAPKDYLSRGHRDAMAWVAENTPPGSAFVVITGVEASGVDFVSEWFPAVAQRASIGTPQGYEWAGGDAFGRRNRLHSIIQACASIRCLETAISDFGYSLEYVYVALPEKTISNKELYDELLSSPSFTILYRSSEAIIFQNVLPADNRPK